MDQIRQQTQNGQPSATTPAAHYRQRLLSWGLAPRPRCSQTQKSPLAARGPAEALDSNARVSLQEASWCAALPDGPHRGSFPIILDGPEFKKINTTTECQFPMFNFMTKCDHYRQEFALEKDAVVSEVYIKVVIFKISCDSVFEQQITSPAKS